MENIPADKMLNEAASVLIWDNKSFPSDRHGPFDLYQIALPFFAGRHNLADGVKASFGSLAEEMALVMPQNSGTCFYRCWHVTLRHCLYKSGLSFHQVKQFPCPWP